MEVLKLSKYNSVLLSASLDGTVKSWDVFSLKEIHSLEAHTDGVLDLVVTDKYLVTVGGDRLVKLWSLIDFALVKEFNSHKRAVTAVDYSAPYNTLATGGTDGVIKVSSCVRFANRHVDLELGQIRRDLRDLRSHGKADRYQRR